MTKVCVVQVMMTVRSQGRHECLGLGPH